MCIFANSDPLKTKSSTDSTKRVSRIRAGRGTPSLFSATFSPDVLSSGIMNQDSVNSQCSRPH